MRPLNGHEVLTPTKDDAALAGESARKLADLLDRDEEIRLEARGSGEELKIPSSTLRLLVRVLDELGRGNAVALTPLRTELTTRQAAELLNVSRPHLVKLVDEGAIPSRRVGSHRRVPLSGLLAYREAWHARRHAALDDLAALSQDLDMGY